MTLFHYVIVGLVIWMLEAVHGIPSWIYGGGYTIGIFAFIVLTLDWANDKREESTFRTQINKELWK